MTGDSTGERRFLELLGERVSLREYELEAYLATIEAGRLTASELADRTSIPQPRVYDTVRNLEDHGLVEVHESRPVNVVAVDPADAFGDLLADFDGFVGALKRRQGAGSSESLPRLLAGREEIDEALHRTIAAGVDDLTVSLPSGQLGAFEDVLAERTREGVEVTLVLSPADRVPSTSAFDYDRIADRVAVRPGVTTPTLVVDGDRRAVYATRPDVDDEDRGIVIGSPAWCDVVARFFGTFVEPTARTLHTGGVRESERGD